MIVPLILLIISLAGVGAASAIEIFSDLNLIAVPSVVASAYLLIRARLRHVQPDQRRRRKIGQSRGAWLKSDQQYIIVDGSNVMHWNDGTPQLETLREVVHQLVARGFDPGVVFDANAGYLLTGKYQHHGAMGKLLGLSEERIMVVDKGNPADPTILAAAKDLGARIVTNDRYKDWADTHPEVHTSGHLVRGGYVAGKLWLDLKTSQRDGTSPLNSAS